MPNVKAHFSHNGPEISGVERASQIAKQLFYIERGKHENDQQCINAIARQSQLAPSIIRRFLLPSRAPKEVGFSVWTRLRTAYRRQLERQLHKLEDEIARLEHLEPDDVAVLSLLCNAKALVSEIEALAGPLSAARSGAEPDQP